MTDRDPKQTPSHHALGGGFRNPYATTEFSFSTMQMIRLGLKWSTIGMQADPGFDPSVPRDFRFPNVVLPVDPSKPRVTWIGHSTFLIELEGLRILTDPVFGQRASPLPFGGGQRLRPIGLTREAVGHVDVVLISHSHYDHLERATVRAYGDSVAWIVPLGLKAWFARQGVTRVTEMDWWNSTDIVAGMRVTMTPAEHGSGRTLRDRDLTLWCGYVITTDTRRLYYVGDTAYNPAQFKEIGTSLGPFDLALIPIGAYEPRSFMKFRHIDPEEALQIHRDVHSRLSVAMHWGSFKLTAEPMMHPPWRLFKAMQASGVAIGEFRVLDHGQAMNF